MPTYSYRCTECDSAFDIHQAFTEDSLTVCPTCGGVLRKVFSPVGVTFSGSGFYRTDSRAAAKSESSTPTPAKTEKADKPAKATPAAASSAPSSSASTS
ncbi:MAG: zinc ribbon domain-containing protein [Rhodoglobus sp.]|nr:zinc ribbon domain-containing protein [Rhodoglobus sp.]